MLAGRFLTDFYDMVARWAEWASGIVENWPDDPQQATLDRATLADIVIRASWSDAAPGRASPGAAPGTRPAG